MLSRALLRTDRAVPGSSVAQAPIAHPLRPERNTGYPRGGRRVGVPAASVGVPVAAPLLPWPRTADDGVTPLGIDLGRSRAPGKPAAYVELQKLVLSSLRKGGIPLDPDDVVQEVAIAIVRRNRCESAYDPRECGFSHYVWMVSGNVIGHMLDARKPHRRVKLRDELPEVEDERDPIGAWQSTEGHQVQWIHSNVEAYCLSVEEAPAPRTMAQLSLFG